ncbi:MAG: tRNA (adenosine(37)-N6)-dimethylallyltransferase MiaA [Rhodoferax sp.]
MTERPTLPPHLALVGPTAAGKTAVALALAQVMPIEIISLDSALVYRGMDIGTAKPSAVERAQVTHHLIDIRDPSQAYSAAEFVRDAQTLMQAIHARGRWPVVVGGTLLYLKALHDGLDTLPAADPAVRQRIEARAAQRGWPALHAELAAVDPKTAARLSPRDAQRIGRALEVYQVTGRPLSALHTIKNVAAVGDSKAFGDKFSYQQWVIALEPTERHWLHARIADRFSDMLRQGFLDEVQALRQRPDLHPDLPALRAVGYRQAWQMLDGQLPASQWVERAVAATRQLAKRQITWLRAMPRRHIVACEARDAPQQVARLALQLRSDQTKATWSSTFAI